MSDNEEAAEAVAEAIRQSAGVKPPPEPTDEEKAEIEERRNKYRNYWAARERESRAKEEAERLAAIRNHNAEVERHNAEVRARAKQRAKEQSERIFAQYGHKPSPQPNPEIAGIKAELVRLQNQRDLDAHAARCQTVINFLDRELNQTEASEPEPYHLGSRFFDPTKTRW